MKCDFEISISWSKYMDKIWYAERIKECMSVKPEIVRLLKEEFKILWITVF